MLLPDKKYQKLLSDLKEKIRSARQKAALSVNQELLGVYWEIGQAIIAQQKEEGWGTKIIDRLSHDLKIEFPDFKGVSVRNLKYMRAFADAYPDFRIVQPPAAQKKITKKSKAIVHVPLAQSNAISDSSIVQVRLAQLSWYHHITLLDKVKSPIERRFFIEQTILNGWSRDAMAWQIENGLYRRQGKAITNFALTLPQPQSDLAQESLKSPYLLGFLEIGQEMHERDLERALVQHVKKFMLELGRGFAYVGNQYNLKVEEDEYFLDLLFYNTKMHSFVVFELKVGEFKPEYAGKLNFYVNTVNEQIKSGDDKPTIGVLLCKTPNETVVRFALKGIDTPLGVADYQLAKAIPGDLQGELPTIEQLEKELDQEAERLQRPVDKKMDRLKD